MMIIDGKREAQLLRDVIKKEIELIKEKNNTVPGLTVILIGDFVPSQIYVKNKEKNAKEVGINSEVVRYPKEVSEQEVLTKIKELNDVSKDDFILDIGPKTTNKIKNIIEKSETVLWNGPAGYFENPNFANGCYEIAKKIVERNQNNNIYSVVGGGDTIAVLNQIDLINNFNFISTAGGAFLEYLEGKELPGIKALN